jgi:hypothetical protein
VQTRIGLHWTDRKREPTAGSYTKASAKAWLDDTLAKARRGELPGMIKTGTTFAAACDDWLDYKRDRKIKLSAEVPGLSRHESAANGLLEAILS